MNLQPSELMKIGLILFLSKYYHRISIDINSFRYLFLPITVLITVILVATQPDLGTSILIAAGGVIVVWLAGVRAKFFNIRNSNARIITNSYLIFKTLSEIENFNFKPRERSTWCGYQIIQSKIAIGSGGLFGKGFLNGSQSYLDYLPENTLTLFYALSEEFGFLAHYLFYCFML